MALKQTLVRASAVAGIVGSMALLGACARPGSGSGTTPTTGVIRILGSPSPSRAATHTAPPTVAVAPTPTTPPPAAAPPSPTNPAGTVSGKRYVVQPGDTLVKIAEQFGVTVDAIVKANNLSNPDLLQVGQELIIPGR